MDRPGMKSTRTGLVKVTEGGIASNTNFTVPAPQVASLSPASGVVGTQVTINGSGFQAAQGSGYVGFYNGGAFVTAAITRWSDAQIVATVPAGAAPRRVAVMAADGTS